jgi:uncharacterized protein (TIGR02599 family)
MTRRISQATLNNYWDYNSNTEPERYLRKSELRFLTGQSSTVIGSAVGESQTRGQCIFFNAPLGFVGGSSSDDREDSLEKYAGLSNLLNTCGYYVAFGKDDNRPAFLNSLPNKPKDRWRYRLMEMIEPSEQFSIYKHTSGTKTQPDAASTYQQKSWVTEALTSTRPPVHALAENIIALVVLPKKSKQEDPSGTQLAPNYSYDSSPVTRTAARQQPQENQLPPVVQVTVVAIDEASAHRITRDGAPPSFDSTLSGLFRSAGSFESDLQALERELAEEKINFRVFTTNISIRGAKWSDTDS